MKLTELHLSQRVIVQLVWSEQRIEFNSDVLDKDDTVIYVSPYEHGGSALELNVTGDKNVVCNLFADDPATNQRISWKGVELTTIDRDGRVVYCIKTHSFNNIANPDDRRLHERIAVQAGAFVFDEQSIEGEKVVLRDISDIGVSFYTSKEFEPSSQHVTIAFSDSIGDRTFDIKVDCSVSRVSKEDGRNIIGCRLLGENKNYQIYGLLKRLKSKSGSVTKEIDSSVVSPAEEDKPGEENNSGDENS